MNLFFNLLEFKLNLLFVQLPKLVVFLFKFGFGVLDMIFTNDKLFKGFTLLLSTFIFVKLLNLFM